MRKVFAILSILVVLTMVLTACGAKATPDPGAHAGAGGRSRTDQSA